MCGKAVDNYGHVMEIFPDYFVTRKMCNKSVKIYPSTIQFIPECYKNKEKCVMKLLLALIYFILFSIDIRLKK